MFIEYLRSRIHLAIFIALVPLLCIFVECAEEKPLTPIESTSAEKLTTYEEMISFLNELHRRTQNFTIETVATSVEGRDIPLLRFSESGFAAPGQRDKLTVLLFAQQHGDEPSGKEAAIQLVRDIAMGYFVDFLQGIDLLLIPQVNPDGSEKQQRRNANDVDLNRNHLILTEPEVIGLHEIFHTYLPEVTLDVHEYGVRSEAWIAEGYQKNFGVQMGAVSNPNVSMEVRGYAWNRVLPYIDAELNRENIRFRRYLVAGDPTGRFRYSTTAINDGRNSMGIYSTFSFIQEGQNGVTITENIHERTRRQLESIKAFLTYFAQNVTEVKRIVREEREKLIQGTERMRVHINMDYVQDPANPTVTVPVILTRSGQEIEKTFNNFYPLVKSTVSVVRPQGYAIPPERTGILSVLKKHHINVQVTEKPIQGLLELYTIDSITQTEIEDKEMLSVEVSKKSSISTIPIGYHIVWCNQLQAAQLITMLEPHSIWGLAQQPEFSSLLSPGSIYPVIRIMRIVED